MALEFFNVPVHRWRYPTAGVDKGLVYTKQYERLMTLIGRAIAADAAVEVEVTIVERQADRPPHAGDPYDVMRARIEMPEGASLPAAKARKKK